MTPKLTILNHRPGFLIGGAVCGLLASGGEAGPGREYRGLIGPELAHWLGMKPSYLDFDKAAYHWRPDVDYRAHPELYRVGKGEQGVLICEPYKSELVPLWRFKTPEIARASSEAIYKKFLAYLRQEDFVGADMARKFLQMGFTRARRYTNYKGGRKYDPKDKHHWKRARATPGRRSPPGSSTRPGRRPRRSPPTPA